MMYAVSLMKDLGMSRNGWLRGVHGSNGSQCNSCRKGLQIRNSGTLLRSRHFEIQSFTRRRGGAVTFLTVRGSIRATIGTPAHRPRGSQTRALMSWKLSPHRSWVTSIRTSSRSWMRLCSTANGFRHRKSPHDSHVRFGRRDRFADAGCLGRLICGSIP